MNTNLTAKFQTGTVYSTGVGSSYEWRFEVTRRTAKFITIRDLLTNEVRRVGVRTDGPYDREWAMPFGAYSMCPVITAA